MTAVLIPETTRLDPVLPAPASSPDAPPRRRRRLRELHVHLGLFGLLVFVAVFPGLVTSHDPYELDGLPFTSPSGGFWFGTDEIGRDLFSRVVHGLQISLFSAALAVTVALLLGGIVGILSGLRPGSWLDRV